MDCPRCNSNAYRKDGKAHARQRYLCKSCRYRYTVAKRSGTSDEATRRQALHLYLEGLGFPSMGRILGFSNVSILNWIRGFGKNPPSAKKESKVNVMKIDEMHS